VGGKILCTEACNRQQILSGDKKVNSTINTAGVVAGYHLDAGSAYHGYLFVPYGCG
jgi:hypothetical protein